MYAFNFEKFEKVDEKACFYTKEADLNVQDWYNNHFFSNRNRKPKSSILMFFGAKNEAKCTHSTWKS